MEPSQAPEVHSLFAGVEAATVTRDLSTLYEIKGYNKEKKSDYCTMETGTFNDVTYCRYILHHHTAASTAGVHETREPSRSIESAIDELVVPEPERELVVYAMAKIKMDPNITVQAKAAAYGAEFMVSLTCCR